MYELTAIIYHDENSDEAEIEYQVYITEKDFENKTLFSTIKVNMNPEVLLYPEDEHEEIGCLQYDLVESERAKVKESERDKVKDELNVLIISDIVNNSDFKWIIPPDMSMMNNNANVKSVRINDNLIYMV